MKKAILLPLLVLCCSFSMAVKAASIALYGGTPPPNTTVTIDAYNNVTITGPWNAYIQRIDFYRNSAPTYYPVAIPGYTQYTFNSDNAYMISVGWSYSEYPYNFSAHYYITY
ncbi:hypothetical protein MKQ68_16755 [Chitinophaga horti]|uniref:Uncharacterized protein n=1 Tax=Chitinophaga horti TaxID=2920382 RepID=A0ABY6J091_9BACT|nr:hypothetical protein [Chitinophaga horti]UYQ91739.1 hypothetical protein MKQ68_16755 [Chitinophaga horti]